MKLSESDETDQIQFRMELSIDGRLSFSTDGQLSIYHYEIFSEPPRPSKNERVILDHPQKGSVLSSSVDIDFSDHPSRMKLSRGERVFRLARRFEGLRTTRSAERAALLFGEAAHLGHPESMLHYSACYHFGIGLEENLDRYCTWLRKSAEAGYPLAMRRLCGAYESGYFGRGNVGLAEYWMKKAADAGEPECMAMLGAAMVRRGEVQTGLSLVRRSAELGCPGGMFRLGCYLLDGWLGEPDLKPACGLMFRSLDALLRESWKSSSFATDFYSVGPWVEWASLVGELALEGRLEERDLVSIVRMLRAGFLCASKTERLLRLGDAMLELREVDGARSCWRQAARRGVPDAAARLLSVS